MASDLVRKFSEGFWLWHPKVTIRFADAVRLDLLEYGDTRVWAATRELVSLLKPL